MRFCVIFVYVAGKLENPNASLENYNFMMFLKKVVFRGLGNFEQLGNLCDPLGKYRIRNVFWLSKKFIQSLRKVSNSQPFSRDV